MSITHQNYHDEKSMQWRPHTNASLVFNGLQQLTGCVMCIRCLYFHAVVLRGVTGGKQGFYFAFYFAVGMLKIQHIWINIISKIVWSRYSFSEARCPLPLFPSKRTLKKSVGHLLPGLICSCPFPFPCSCLLGHVASLRPFPVCTLPPRSSLVS